MDSRNDCDFLLQGAIWQDSLLQAYRYLHVTFQSILLAIGTGLFVVSMSSDTFPRTLVATVLLLCLWVLHRFTGRKMQEIVLARGQDVNYWHKELIIAEQQLLSNQRHCTKFKIHQQARRQKVAHLEKLFLMDMPIKSEDVENLRLFGNSRGSYPLDL